MIAPIISVTGTKGKTTTVTVIDAILQKLGNNTLRVDTTGHFVNGECRSTLQQSKELWDLVPSVSPGRYLYEFMENSTLRENAVAVLEMSLGCSSLPGMGYGHHKVGIFLNVFEDHLGSSDRLQTKKDIALAKQFIFERLHKNNGWAVANADDELVCSRLNLVPDSCAVLPFGFEFSHFDVVSHAKSGGSYISYENHEVIFYQGGKRLVIADVQQIPWTFNGAFKPSVLNIMAAAAGIIAFYDGAVPNGLREAVEAVRLDPYGGRLTVLKNNKKVTIIADYAHEKFSLSNIGDLAKTLISGGRVIGVVRLAHDRTDELMHETAHAIADHFDAFVVYDKIDGYWRHPTDRIRRFPEVVGRTSKVFAKALREQSPHVVRVIREDEAIQHAAEIAQPGDVVVVIVNDNIKRSIEFIQNSFEAEFV